MVVVPRERGGVAGGAQPIPQALGDVQDEVLFLEPAGADGAVLLAAVAWIDHHAAQWPGDFGKLGDRHAGRAASGRGSLTGEVVRVLRFACLTGAARSFRRARRRRGNPLSLGEEGHGHAERVARLVAREGGEAAAEMEDDGRAARALV